MNRCVDALPHSTPSRFLALDRVDHCDATRATARRAVAVTPAWQGLEAMAQLAALHARQRSDFTRHAFLLTVRECAWPPDGELHGPLRIRTGLLAESDRAATYQAVITPDSVPADVAASPPPMSMSATLIIGRTDYDARFNSATLAARYREIFAWLTRTA